ncbi:MAG TPA: CbiX/SirB N-terminal domain-containing protein, partial [Aldersonia sp.]
MVATGPLIAVAHGSRDPRSAATMHALVERIREARPSLDVRLSFLDLNAPSVDRTVDGVAADGYTSAVAVPLLLGSAFHARVDLPRLLATARYRRPSLSVLQADVLGTDDRIVRAVRSRAVEAGADPDDDRLGVAVAAVGSSSDVANERTAQVARRIASGTRWRTRICFATACGPTVAEALSGLRAEGAERFV